MPLRPNWPLLLNDTHTFPAIAHPTGSISLSVTYLTSPNFRLEQPHFNEGQGFTPILTDHTLHSRSKRKTEIHPSQRSEPAAGAPIGSGSTGANPKHSGNASPISNSPTGNLPPIIPSGYRWPDITTTAFDARHSIFNHVGGNQYNNEFNLNCKALEHHAKCHYKIDHNVFSDRSCPPETSAC